MRKIFSYLLILAISLTFVSAKMANGADSLNKSLDRYFEYSKAMNIDGVMDMMYDKVFTVVPKEKMSAMMKQAFSNPNAPTLIDFKFSKDNEIKKYSGGEYSIVKWDGHMTMKTGTTDEKKEQMLVDMIKSRMPDTTVELDKKSHTLHLRTKNQTLLAIRENGKDWKVVEDKMARQFKIIPKEILEDLEKNGK